MHKFCVSNQCNKYAKMNANFLKELDDIQTYPTEIIPGLLYLGNWRHGNMPYIQKDVKIKAHINCCLEQGTL